MLPVADSVALARVVDGVLVVTQANRVSARDVRGAFERLERVGAPPIGVVLNRARHGGSEVGYGYGYGYNYRQPEEARDETPAGDGVPTPSQGVGRPADDAPTTPAGSTTAGEIR